MILSAALTLSKYWMGGFETLERSARVIGVLSAVERNVGVTAVIVLELSSILNGRIYRCSSGCVTIMFEGIISSACVTYYVINQSRMTMINNSPMI